MSETKTVVGTLSGIMEKSGDWREIHIAVPGKQYPVKVSTKIEELVQLARAAGENVMEWTYTEQDSGNPNPHKPGTNYVNRYFEGVAPVGSTPGGAESPSPASGASSEGMSKDEWRLKDNAAHKRACIAIAVSALSHTMPSDPSSEELKTFNERVMILALGWYRNVIAERDDPTGEDVPF